MITETCAQEISYERKRQKTGQNILCFLSVITIPFRKTFGTYGKILLFCLSFFIYSGLNSVNAMNYEEWTSDYSAISLPFHDNSFSVHSARKLHFYNNLDSDYYPLIQPFQNKLPSEYYSMKNGLFAESSSANSRAVRSLPEDWDDGENGLGLVPVEGNVAYILLVFALLYFLWLRRRIQYAKQHKQ